MYCDEVQEAIDLSIEEFECKGNGSVEKDTERFRKLIELGVKLGLEAAAIHLRAHSNPGHAEYLMLSVKPADVLVKA